MPHTLRPTVEDLEQFLGEKRPVLEHGFVRLIDYMGDDAAVVQAARVSHGLGTKSPQEDRALIHYLMRHDHTTPFEMCEIKFHMKLPIFVARQWIRHRTANVNEFSMRYSEAPTEYYCPTAAQLGRQSGPNKQGRADLLTPEDALLVQQLICADADQAQNNYRLLRNGFDLSRELARIGLGLNTFTEWYWKTDLHNLFRFLRLRLHKTAQYEIRVYAEAIRRAVEVWVPTCYEAFVDHQLAAFKLSGPMLVLLRGLLADRAHLVDTIEAPGMTKRECDELFAAIGWRP